MRLTGFRTYGEFVDETEPLERRLLIESIEAWHEQQADTAGGSVPGM